jgi:heme exporter protein CcmD
MTALPDFGAYAGYVWAAYGLTVAVLAVLVATPALRLHRIRRKAGALGRPRRRRLRPPEGVA